MFALKSVTRGIKTASSFIEAGLIGIDFALENINLAQFEKTVNGDVALRTCSTIKYPISREELLNSPKKLRPLLRQAMKEYGFKGKDIVSSIPSSDVRILSLHYSKPKNSDDGEAILQALQERIDDDVSKYVIDYLPIRSVDKDGEQLALVALVKHELVISYLELLRHSGLHVEALEIRPAAIKRLIYSMYKKEEYKNILVINFGTNKSFLTIISGRRLLFDQEFNFGSDVVVEKMSSILDMTQEATQDLILKHGFDSENKKESSQTVYSDEDITKTLLEVAKPKFDELIDEINRVLIFAASENHGESITKVFLLGSLAHWKGVDKYLNKNLNISVKTLQDPLSKFINSSSNISHEYSHAPNMAIAAGLALKRLVEYE